MRGKSHRKAAIQLCHRRCYFRSHKASTARSIYSRRNVLPFRSSTSACRYPDTRFFVRRSPSTDLVSPAFGPLFVTFLPSSTPTPKRNLVYKWIAGLFYDPTIFYGILYSRVYSLPGVIAFRLKKRHGRPLKSSICGGHTYLKNIFRPHFIMLASSRLDLQRTQHQDIRTSSVRGTMDICCNAVFGGF